VAGILKGEILITGYTLDLHVFFSRILVSEAKDFKVKTCPVQLGELLRQIGDMYARPAINMGRIFIRQKDYMH
jgi:hypothetical protein